MADKSGRLAVHLSSLLPCSSSPDGKIRPSTVSRASAEKARLAYDELLTPESNIARQRQQPHPGSFTGTFPWALALNKI
jgi:hypothetical protein